MPPFNPSATQLLRMQREQHRHDKQNHSDIQCLHKGERLKHYGLHFCKYVGRLARGAEDSKTLPRTIVDATLVSLSAANTLSQRLFELSIDKHVRASQRDPFLEFADAAGRFADACEKFDHLEDFPDQARLANLDIFLFLIDACRDNNINLEHALEERRKELRMRAFYANGD